MLQACPAVLKTPLLMLGLPEKGVPNDLTLDALLENNGLFVEMWNQYHKQREE